MGGSQIWNALFNVEEKHQSHKTGVKYSRGEMPAQWQTPEAQGKLPITCKYHIYDTNDAPGMTAISRFRDHIATQHNRYKAKSRRHTNDGFALFARPRGKPKKIVIARIKITPIFFQVLK